MCSPVLIRPPHPSRPYLLSSRRYYLLLHGAALATAAVGADLRVSCASAAEVVVAKDGLGMSSARYDDLAPPWRYMVDSVGGGSAYAPWVLNRHAHPLSAVPNRRVDE